MVKDLVTTIIPNWNLKDDLGECLDSLSHITYANHQIIVVDNGSNDGSVDFVKRRYPWVTLIALPQNQGYAAALNAGIVRALEQGSSYVFALNNDTIVEPDVLTKLVTVIKSDSSIGIAAPKVLYYDDPNRIYRLGDRKYRYLPLPVGFGNKWRDRHKFSGIMEFDYVSGCAMLIRASLFRVLGLFDTSFFMYYEDADFCRRAKEHDYRIVCVGDVVIYHKASLSAKKEKITISYIRARNRVRFYRRYKHGLHPVLTYITLAIVALWRTLLGLIRGQSEMVRAYLQGLWDGSHDSSPPSYTWLDEDVG